jgi:hypothetical protein
MPWLEEKEQEERNIKLAGKKAVKGKKKSSAGLKSKA